MAKATTLSFEFYPPQTKEGVIKLKQTAKDLNQYNPEFFSVTFGAGGSTKEKTLDTVLELRELGFNATPHISCISSSKMEIKELLDKYKSHKINHLVALRGDNPSGSVNFGELNYANELVSFIREHTGDHFHLEVAAYPEIHPEAKSYETDIEFLKQKFAAGASSAITQYFFNADAYKYFVDRCQKAGIDQAIYPGIMPIVNFDNLKRFSQNCGAEIPRWLSYRIESLKESPYDLTAFCTDFITELCESVLSSGAPGIHFYTMNMVYFEML